MVPSDIQWKMSVPSATQGNTEGQSDPNASLGGFVSTTQVALGVLFDDITGAENTANQIDYRCIFIHNTSSQKYHNPIIWISEQKVGGGNLAIGLDGNGPSPANSLVGQAQVVGSVLTPPIGVTFTFSSNEGEGLALGDLPPDYCQAVWLQRSINNASAMNYDGAILSVKGISNA